MKFKKCCIFCHMQSHAKRGEKARNFGPVEIENRLFKLSFREKLPSYA